MTFSSSYLQILIEVDDAILCISCASVSNVKSLCGVRN